MDEENPATADGKSHPVSADENSQKKEMTREESTLPNPYYTRRRSVADRWMLREQLQRRNSVTHRYCFPCLAKYTKPITGAPLSLKLRYMFSCPPHGQVARWLTLGLLAILLWATLWAILGSDVEPGGNIFTIVVLFIVCSFLGLVVEAFGLPRLLGVLLGGILLGNVPNIDIARDIDRDWSFAIRKIAVVVVLIRAGIGSDPRALVKRKWILFRLMLFPVLVEGVAVGVTSHFLLNFPWLWSFVLGFVIAPMSAAAAIPFMLQFQAGGYGVAKGIPTTIKFGACLDNVVAISIFSVILDIVFNESPNLASTIIVKGPVQLLIGLSVGVTCGIILWYLPHRNSKRKTLYRFTFLFGLCLFGAFATGTASFSSAGPLGVISTALVASLKWRRQGWKGDDDPLPPIFGNIWKICQVLLAGMIGSLLDVRNLDWEIVGLVVAIISIGLSFRLLTAFMMVQCTVLNTRERLFVMISWIPKATVQAAIGSMALDRAHTSNASPEDVRRGEIILMSAVLAILLTAPIGATAIASTGKRLLSKAVHHKSRTKKIRHRNQVLANSGLDNPSFCDDNDIRRASTFSEGTYSGDESESSSGSYSQNSSANQSPRSDGTPSTNSDNFTDRQPSSDSPTTNLDIPMNNLDIPMKNLDIPMNNLDIKSNVYHISGTNVDEETSPVDVEAGCGFNVHV